MEEKKENLRMYILIKSSVDVGHAVNSCGHAGMMAGLEWPPKSDPLMDEWYADSFRKCTCKVSDEQFEKAKEYGDYIVVTEAAFDQDEVILVFKPRREWPKFFKFLTLYK